ncbi:type II toxin-antitoxin system RatA family toxin [Sphingomonas sp. RHCKR7]|uniref:type II toxin-antitoxin system RatA family toxin n=1 Tax=Sphingomonas folli TaxID=2862497 RepID=UPI001C66AD38|nr:type II toxin-antitoxin system RatA family toxin [Sphingomonas folli]MBW6525664.1 type II toxin-antitoxin system RatA family toxin [Sphingomonas folli]
MPKHSETRRLPYSPEQMFDLVADVRRYPEFLPWVTAMRVRRDGETETLADMIVGFKGLRETFTSKVAKARPDMIRVEYVDGPLKYLHNDWRFRPAGEGGSLVDFTVDFAFKNRMFEMLAGQVFGVALRRMIGAFEERARALYGDSSTGSSSGSGSSSSSAHSAA